MKNVMCLQTKLLSRAISGNFLILVVSAAAFAQTKISIAQAQKMPLGTEVAVNGTVTVASGAFISSFDDYGFQIQDKTGGMYIAIKNDLHLRVGQNVRLTGKLNQTPLKFPIIETEAAFVHVLPTRSRQKAIIINTGKITDPTVGKLIRLSGTVTKLVEAVAPYGFRVSLDDGSGEVIAYVSTSTNISPRQFAVGSRFEVTGIAGKFNSHFQIYPRSPADVTSLK